MWTQKAEHGCGRQEAASASNGFPSIATTRVIIPMGFLQAASNATAMVAGPNIKS